MRAVHRVRSERARHAVRAGAVMAAASQRLH
jgi:hypothetical protein